MANVKNPYQGDATKALCVCSAGLLRSPSIARFLNGKGYNTRACGIAFDYALIPISHALLEWADEIHVVEEQVNELLSCMEELNIGNKKVYVYQIPDCFGTFDPELMRRIEEEYNKI